MAHLQNVVLVNRISALRHYRIAILRPQTLSLFMPRGKRGRPRRSVFD